MEDDFKEELRTSIQICNYKECSKHREENSKETSKTSNQSCNCKVAKSVRSLWKRTRKEIAWWDLTWLTKRTNVKSKRLVTTPKKTLRQINWTQKMVCKKWASSSLGMEIRLRKLSHTSYVASYTRLMLNVNNSQQLLALLASGCTLQLWKTYF